MCVKPEGFFGEIKTPHVFYHPVKANHLNINIYILYYQLSIGISFPKHIASFLDIFCYWTADLRLFSPMHVVCFLMRRLNFFPEMNFYKIFVTLHVIL